MTNEQAYELVKFQSTLSSRRATIRALQNSAPVTISIHALLTESDHGAHRQSKPVYYFNPRSPHGERRLGMEFYFVMPAISIHALLTESDEAERPDVLGDILFQSTLSSRRATVMFPSKSFARPYFNPRSPHGERRLGYPRRMDSQRFQSTLSSRRATFPAGEGHVYVLISIHALLTESDDGPQHPRHSEGPISIHALLTESDGKPLRSVKLFDDFNPRSPHGERQQIPPNWPYRFCLKCQF